MTAVLVTGATTPLGVETVRVLLKRPEVTGVLAVGRPGDAFPAPRRSHCRFEAMDLSRARNLRRLLFGLATQREITTVIHMALHRRVHNGGSPVRTLNVETTRTLLDLCEHHPTVRRLVFRSHAEIYRIRPELPDVLGEESPVELSVTAPQWLRDRAEADLTTCARIGSGHLSIAVLRMAECLAPDVGSQLYDYLSSRVCLRPLGFDPMLNLLSLADAARALTLAALSDAQGVFNIPGADTLPLSVLIRKWGCRDVPTPGPLLSWLYALRRRFQAQDFSYRLNRWRFHYNGIPDGTRAAHHLGYRPQAPLHWPQDQGTSSLTVGSASAPSPH